MTLRYNKKSEKINCIGKKGTQKIQNVKNTRIYIVATIMTMINMNYTYGSIPICKYTVSEQKILKKKVKEIIGKNRRIDESALEKREKQIDLQQQYAKCMISNIKKIYQENRRKNINSNREKIRKQYNKTISGIGVKISW